MNYNINELTPILKTITVPAEDFYDDSDATLSFKKRTKKRLRFYHVKIKSGLTKIVIIFPDRDYVIKIPFNKYLDWEDDSSTAYVMSGATGDNTDGVWDYCAQEVYIYNLAKLYHLEKAFPETIYLGKWNNYPIYLQEKCSPINDIDLDPSTEEEINDLSYEVSNLMQINDFPYIYLNWICMYYLTYGKLDTVQLLKFIKFYGIDDLHTGNIGFSSLDDRPVLIDFSGFYS